jgi:uncharacterized protein YcsI (UPF0317 family)
MNSLIVENGKLKIDTLNTGVRDLYEFPILEILSIVPSVVNLVKSIVESKKDAVKYRKLKQLTESEDFNKLTKEQKSDLMLALIS